MNRSISRPAIETLAELVAALGLGGACAFATAQAVPLVAALAAGVAVMGGALFILARVDRPQAEDSERFALVDFLFDEDDGSILLLDDPIVPAADELLLDDPLPRVDEDSRVVRLFAAAPLAARDGPDINPPGEMLSRIEDFLGSAKTGMAGAPPRAVNAASEEANAALHAALADIRRSLRQA